MEALQNDDSSTQHTAASTFTNTATAVKSARSNFMDGVSMDLEGSVDSSAVFSKEAGADGTGMSTEMAEEKNSVGDEISSTRAMNATNLKNATELAIHEASLNGPDLGATDAHSDSDTEGAHSGLHATSRKTFVSSSITQVASAQIPNPNPNPNPNHEEGGEAVLRGLGGPVNLDGI